MTTTKITLPPTHLLALLSGCVHLNIVARNSVLCHPHHIHIIPLRCCLLLPPRGRSRVLRLSLGTFRLGLSLGFGGGEVVWLDLEQVVVSCKERAVTGEQQEL